MKTLLAASAALVLTAVVAPAQSLLLDFGQTTVASPYLTTSPGHAAGTVPLTDTSWNKISSSASVSSLVYGNSAAATGVTLTMGQEAVVGNNTISYSTAITQTNLAGTGGAATGQQSLLGPGSIYGDDSSSTAVGKDGFFGGGSGGAGAAIGLRIDGLAVGDYVVYVMARNTNSNGDPSGSMNIYYAAGAAAETFDFSSLTPSLQSNTTYASEGYAGQYNTFQAGNNYVAVHVSIAAGESLYLAIDGANPSVDTRGFVNAVQVVAVPEPSAVAAGMVGLLALVASARRRKQA